MRTRLVSACTRLVSCESACCTHMACVATWSFGLEAVITAAGDIKAGKDCADVLENSINVVEDDPNTGIYYVGRGCYPNREGVVQLDAAMMRGSNCSFGAVAGLERKLALETNLRFSSPFTWPLASCESCFVKSFRMTYSCSSKVKHFGSVLILKQTIIIMRYAKPISVARRVLDHPSLSMLVGNGATQFALEQGFSLEENSKLLTQETKQAYEDFKGRNKYPEQTGHDTLSVLCVDLSGCVAAGVSTSGPPFKHPGRVGDSPLPGCGLYADNEAGAAAATGDGERIMQFCPSFHIVKLIKSGLSPQQACEDVIRLMKESSKERFEVGVIALNRKGEVGGASTVREWKDARTGQLYGGFPYARWNKETDISVIITEPGI